MEFEGKVVLITGGAQGIGAAAARRFAAEGASVVVADVDAARLKTLEASIARMGGRLRGVTADCGTACGVEQAIATAVETYGGLDVLVPAAVVRPTKPFLAVTEEDLDRAWAVNVKGCFLAVQRAVPEFRKRGGGKVVLLSSTLGFAAAPNFSVYCTCKGAVVNMVRALAHDLARENINVNAVAPGPIMTEGTREEIRKDPSLEQHRTATMPLRRFGEPEEIAEAILFLASPRSAYMHGHNMVVDGGYLAV